MPLPQPAAEHAGPARRNASTPGAACGMLSKSKAAAPKGADAAADASAGAPAPGATPPARRTLPLPTMETATRSAALCPRTGASKRSTWLSVPDVAIGHFKQAAASFDPKIHRTAWGASTCGEVGCCAG